MPGAPRKAFLMRGFGLGRTFSAASCLISQPALPGRAALLLISRLGVKETSFPKEGFCSKSQINEENLKEIKVAASCARLPSLPLPFCPLTLFCSLCFLPFCIYLSFLPPSFSFHPSPSSLQAPLSSPGLHPTTLLLLPSLCPLPPTLHPHPHPTLGRGGLFSLQHLSGFKGMLSVFINLGPDKTTLLTSPGGTVLLIPPISKDECPKEFSPLGLALSVF